MKSCGQVIVCIALAASTCTGALAQVAAPPAATPAGAVDAGVPTGTGLVVTNAASPQPNPNLAHNFAMPDKRGFIRAEPVFVYPFLAVGAGHNDNLTGVNANPIGSSFMLVSPRVYADVKRGGSTHSVTYAGNYGRYFSSSADDFNEHELVAATNNQFTARADLNASAYLLSKQDARGSVYRAFSAEPDRWRGWGLAGTFGYGARNAPGRLEFELGATSKTYTNNRPVTELFDVSAVTAGGRFYYRLAPGTRALAEIRHTAYDYKSGASPYDNREWRYQTGVTWDATAATTGTVKVGWMSKRFDASGQPGISVPTFDALVRWSPRTYSTFDFALQRAAYDSTGTGFAYVSNNIGATWNHRWKEFISTRALLSRLDTEFKGVERSDHLTTVSIGGYFDARRWLRLGMEVTHQRRDSSIGNFEFSRNLVMFTLGGTI